MANIIIGGIVLLIVLLAARSIYKNKKAGKSCSCGSECGGCGGSESCGSKVNK